VDAGLSKLAPKQAELAALDLEQLTARATELAKALRPANQRAARAWKDREEERPSPARPSDRGRWERFAVGKALPDVGAKLAAASTDDEGMTLGHVRIADDVADISRHPDWDDNRLGWRAFRKQNGEKGYADSASAILTPLHAATATSRRRRSLQYGQPGPVHRPVA
jgi:hypothetical protein